MPLSFFSRVAQIDKELFLYLNSKHLIWLDPIMITLSSYTLWSIVATSILLVMFFRKGKSGRAASLFLLPSFGFNALINNIIKYIISRPRPIHVDAWDGIIRTLEEYDASYSFFSAHSSNSFCVAVFSSLFFRNKRYSIIISLWAVSVAYSRIYVGKHYPLDVLCGIFFGIFTGILGYKLYEYYCIKKIQPKEDL